jgi:glycosyltransferase involved in cell wall biosynthesis
MRICYIGDGRSVHTQRLLSLFAAKGHEMHIITDTPLELKGVTIHELKRRGGGWFSFMLRAFQTRKFIKKIKPDIVHAHFLMGYGFFGAFSSFRPFLITMWGNEISPEVEPKIKNSRIGLRVGRHTISYTLKRVDLIQTLDHYQKELLIGAGFQRENIVVLYNYVDTNIFSPDRRSRKLRDELGIGNGNAIICVRGFDPHYDVSSFIGSIPHVLKEEPNAMFLLAGEQGSKKDKEEILNLAEKLGIGKNVRFVGHIRLKDMPTYLASCDIHVDPASCGAGIGHSNMEAMSCGLPRIAAKKNGIEETVTEGVTGYTFEARDPFDLAEKVKTLIRDESLRKGMGAKCREFVVNANRIGKNEIGIERYYDNLLTSYKRMK